MTYDMWMPPLSEPGREALTTLVASGRGDEVIRIDVRGDRDSASIYVVGFQIPLSQPALVGEAALAQISRSTWRAIFTAATPPPSRPEVTEIVAASAGDLIALTLRDRASVIGELAINPSRKSSCIATGTDLTVSWDPYGWRKGGSVAVPPIQPPSEAVPNSPQ